MNVKCISMKMVWTAARKLGWWSLWDDGDHFDMTEDRRALLVVVRSFQHLPPDLGPDSERLWLLAHADVVAPAGRIAPVVAVVPRHDPHDHGVALCP